MNVYECLLIFKFLAIMGFAGGAVTALLSESPKVQHHAAHRLASPSLLLVWLTGTTLVLLRGWPLFELWISGALLLSLLAHALLTYAVARHRRDGRTWAGIVIALLGVLSCMVVKPTWAEVWGG